MRYSSAVVLGALAAGQAAALNPRHASFHSRRQAEAKRAPGYENVDWAKVSYDLNDVDWDKVFGGSSTPTPTPTPTPAAQVAEVAAQEVKTSATPEPTSAAPAYTSEAAKPTETKAAESDDDDSGSDLGDFLEDIWQGVEDIVKKLGIVSKGVNDKSNNGGIWIGDDSNWKVEFTNDADKDLVLFCWEAKGYTGFSLNVAQPAISVGLKPGEKTTISWAENVPSACSPAFDTTVLDISGACGNTWFEVEFNEYGTFDISRNVNMNGTPISAKGSKCLSDMDTCVFKCKNGMNKCTWGNEYDLFNCGASNGGGGGYDANVQGTGGGCSMAQGSETIKVTLSG
ncbi:hypothetical protein BS50DRAFT_644532 [Corynespora cassiicola Philippines]|uniref:Effector 5 n=1 Tax=Corynespora cassiicola Philippines TaxID=1448308 RepID=A0A2T2PD69_CORCC|nr:hypothetical protein BS50DRAFT_644532 [Corynespora cassiicola Philippines]